jgi:hypothetical protein
VALEPIAVDPQNHGDCTTNIVHNITAWHCQWINCESHRAGSYGYYYERVSDRVCYSDSVVCKSIESVSSRFYSDGASTASKGDGVEVDKVTPSMTVKPDKSAT